MKTQTPPRTGPGRPPTGKKQRDHQALFYLAEDDGVYLTDLAERLGFRSRSQMLTALVERLIIGGFSGMSFLKVGNQFANLIATKPPMQSGLYFGVRPLPPLIPEQDEPSDAQIVPFLKVLLKAAR